jgi:hypothetical protein
MPGIYAAQSRRWDTYTRSLSSVVHCMCRTTPVSCPPTVHRQSAFAVSAMPCTSICVTTNSFCVHACLQHAIVVDIFDRMTMLLCPTRCRSPGCHCSICALKQTGNLFQLTDSQRWRGAATEATPCASCYLNETRRNETTQAAAATIDLFMNIGLQRNCECTRMMPQCGRTISIPGDVLHRNA